MDKLTKKKFVNLACSFCKKRHLKCSGSLPCVQCVSRNEECTFGNNQKRGRKPKVVKIPSPTTNTLNLTSYDEAFHSTFLIKFMERISIIFPYYTPKCFSLEISPFFTVKLVDEISWSKIQQLNSSNVNVICASDLLKTIEYTLACAHGSRICNTSSDVSDMFIAKTESLFQLLGSNLDSDPSLANHLIILHELAGTFYFSMSRNFDATHQCSFHSMYSYTIYNLYKPYISADVANKMFFYQAGISSDLTDAYHFVKKVSLTSNSFTNCINVLVGVGAVSSSILTRQHNEEPIKTKLFNKLLYLMRECESSYSQNVLTKMPLLEVLWAINKAFILHSLNMPFEAQPLDLLHKLISMSPAFMGRKPGNPGVLNAMIFMLYIIPRSIVPMETWNFCMNILNDKESQYSGLMKLLSKFSEEQRIVQIEEELPSELDPNLFLELGVTESDIDSLLNNEL